MLAFADFMAAATRAPGRQNPIPASARGDSLFDSWAARFVTHEPSLLRLWNAHRRVHGADSSWKQIIHPFSDFALHNIGTGDGIVQNAGQGSVNQMRTAPLWGFARNELMRV